MSVCPYVHLSAFQVQKMQFFILDRIYFNLQHVTKLDIITSMIRTNKTRTGSRIMCMMNQKRVVKRKQNFNPMFAPLYTAIIQQYDENKTIFFFFSLPYIMVQVLVITKKINFNKYDTVSISAARKVCSCSQYSFMLENGWWYPSYGKYNHQKFNKIII